jgi:hypothetical protein
MEFQNPTTKAELYQELNKIFHYYRVVFAEYEQTPLEQLELERLQFTPSTNAQLTEKATALLAEKAEKEYNEKLQKLVADLEVQAELLTKQPTITQNAISSVEQIYAESEEKIRLQAEKNGLIHTSAYLDKITFLENEKNSRIAQINQEHEKNIARYNAEIRAINSQLVEVESTANVVNPKALQAKIIELKDEESEIEREVFKYNNGIDEKEQKSKNAVIRENATLRMRYLEIRAHELTHDQLVELGYYDDVLACTCAYYDTLAPATAFAQIKNDSKLMIYLDDVYQNVVYMYGIRSGEIG